MEERLGSSSGINEEIMNVPDVVRVYQYAMVEPTRKKL